MKENLIKTKSFQFALHSISIYKSMLLQKEFIISKQFIRSSTSIGANVQEADAGISKKDFVAKMSIASKEARESLYWLRLLQKSQLVKHDFTSYFNQAEEIVRIITAIVKSSQLS